VRGLQDAGHPVNITYPAAVIGPLDLTLTEPHEGLLFIMRAVALDTTTGIQYVDVRDVADAQVTIIKNAYAGQRITLGGHYYTWRTLGHTLERITGRYLFKPRVPAIVFKMAGKLGDWMSLFGVHSVVNSEGVRYATQWVCTDDSFYLNEMKGAYRNADDTMADAVFSLWTQGFINRKEAGLLASRIAGSVASR
jgi:hypothetical protein